MNNLNDVYQLHCDAQPLQKAKRDVFMKGDMDDVRNQFQVNHLQTFHSVCGFNQVSDLIFHGSHMDWKNWKS